MTRFFSLEPNGLSRVFSRTMIWKHQFFGTQPSLWSNSHIHKWLWLDGPLLAKWCLCFLLCCLGVSQLFFQGASNFFFFFNFMAAVTICSDSGAQENKICHCCHIFPSIRHDVMGLDATILDFLMLSFKSVFFHSIFQPHQETLYFLFNFTFSSFSYFLLGLYDQHVWGCCYFFWLSWFQLVIHPAWHFIWCTLHGC